MVKARRGPLEVLRLFDSLGVEAYKVTKKHLYIVTFVQVAYQD